ncbi:hypothetical protein NQ314_011936 [Rhamnusium bicolor]|uniref:Uncharacterized protein n=1 Tax=Rhamnusium bicolor TaxID=1586634 RepID=A0AAV8XFK6_9CUCU|nr:hypothetical protein NQ314_011936 [Rhamnusium bicolor]
MMHVYSNNILLTTRFLTCYDNVVVNLKLMDDYGTVIQEVTGTKNILLPALVLEYREKIMRIKTSNEVFVKERRSTLSASSSIKSFDKSSKKSERNSLRSRSGGATSRKSLTEDETVYLIEASVVDNTWPLTAEEWKNIQNLKADMLYGASLRETSSGNLR